MGQVVVLFFDAEKIKLERYETKLKTKIENVNPNDEIKAKQEEPASDESQQIKQEKYISNLTTTFTSPIIKDKEVIKVIEPKKMRSRKIIKPVKVEQPKAIKVKGNFKNKKQQKKILEAIKTIKVAPKQSQKIESIDELNKLLFEDQDAEQINKDLQELNRDLESKKINSQQQFVSHDAKEDTFLTGNHPPDLKTKSDKGKKLNIFSDMSGQND